MKNNVLDCTANDFHRGRTLRATVKAVGKTGVMVEMPDGRGSGVITPRCWGDGIARKKALASIRPGDEFDVIVRLYDARALTLSLVLADRAAPLPKKDWKSVRKAEPPASARYPHKPEFQPLAQGAVFLWDAANLLGAIGAENAAQTFNAISGTLTEQGYKTMFFIERRCLTWARCNQRTEDDASALDAFARRDDVIVVEGGGEADYAILQMAEALPNSVCVSRDRFCDYAHAYPGIVGTDRVRTFSVAHLAGKTLILVSGIAHAITVEERPVASTSSVGDSDARKGLLAVADEYLRHGDAPHAERIYAKAAKDDPAAYRALADMYREGSAVPTDGKKAAHYERLARASEKSRKACLVRDRRRRAEAIRSGSRFVSHFSAKRRKALSLATFASVHEAICEYRKFKKARRGKASIRGRAA